MGLPAQLDDFEGTWTIARRIEDRLGPEAHFSGRAVFSPASEGLLYTETGILHSGGQSFAATRRYQWRPEPEGIAVYFDDGRFFHRFALTVAPCARHACAPDQYEVSYDFSGWPIWQAAWNVCGPRKDYRMVSEFRRG